MQVILDSLFARPGSTPIYWEAGKKGGFREWTRQQYLSKVYSAITLVSLFKSMCL